MAKKKKDEDKLNFDSTINDILNGSYNSSSSSSNKSKNIYSSDYAYNSATDSADDIINKILSNTSKTKSNYDDNVINPDIDVNYLIDSVIQEANALEQYSIMKQKENEERAKAEAAKRAREDYYKENKDTIINNRTSDLIYNWNMENTPVTSWEYKDISGTSLKDRLGIKDLQVKTFLSTDENEKYNNLRNNYAKQREYFNNSFNRPEYGPQNQNHYQLRSYEPFSEERAEELIKLEKSSYERDISDFNKALNSGKVKAAQNAIQRINTRYFGADYSDGIWASIGNSITGNDDKDISQLMNRFNTNINKLSTINDSIKNTTDIKTLANLNAERDKLELENQLIQYNRLLYIESNKSTIDSIDALTIRMEQPFRNIDWSDVDDTNFFTKVGSYLNKTIQTTGALSNFALEGTFGSLNLLATDDMDEGFARNATGVVVDTATYLIPYVGQVRLGMTIAKDTSVVVPYLMNFTGMEEESALLGKTPTEWNALGAILDVAAVYTSEKVFGNIRGRFGISEQLNFHLQTGKDILKTMAIESTSEAAEEFIQTYAEHMMYNDGFGFSDLTDRELFIDAVQSAGAAFVLTAGLSATSGLISNTKNNVLNDNMLVRTDTTDSYKGLATQKNLDTQKLPSFRSDRDLYDYVTTKLKNNEIVSLISPNNLDYKMSNIDIKTGDISLDTTKSNVKSGSDIMVNDVYSKNNTAVVLVPSHEMSTYIKGLNPNANIIVADTSSKNFSQSLQSVLKYTATTNIATIDTTKKLPDKSVVEQKVIKDLNKVSNELRTEAIKVTESLPTKNTIEQTASTELNKVATKTKTKAIEAKETKKVIQDILVPGDYNNSPLEIANKIKTETAKEVKQYSEGSKKFQEQYLKYAKKVNESLGLDSPDNRAYIRTVDGNNVIFNKTGDNTYEATNTVRGEGNLLANVKSNGKIINGNLDIPVGLTKHAVRSLNTMIDTLDMNGNYLTEQSTGKDVSKLISQNKAMSGEILQTLGYDAIMSGTNKLKLTTANDNLDNFNLSRELDNLNTQTDKIISENKTSTKEATPEQVVKTIKESKPISIEDNSLESPISSDHYVSTKNDIVLENSYAMDDGTVASDSVWFDPEVDEAINTINIKNKKDKVKINNAFLKLRMMFFEQEAAITGPAKKAKNLDVQMAVYKMHTVNNISDTNINKGQLDINNNVIGKSQKEIFKPLKTKKDKDLFDKTVTLLLNAERLESGMDPIYEKISAKQSRDNAARVIAKHPEFNIILDDLQTYNNNSLDKLVSAGILTKQGADDLKSKYKYYVPIYTSQNKDLNYNDSSDLKTAMVNDPIKEVTKAGQNRLNIFAAMENKEFNQNKAIATNNLAKEIKKSGLYDVENSINSITYFEDGKPAKINTSQEVIIGVRGSNIQAIDDFFSLPIIRYLPKMQDFKRKMLTTYDPVYQSVNLLRDFQDSQFIHSKYKTVFFKNYIKGMYNLAANTEIANEFKKTGIITPVQSDNKFVRLASNFESTPKMAEWLSSLDKGNNSQQALIDAKDVNMDWGGGGYLSKQLSRNGFLFFNSSMVALDKTIDTTTSLVRGANTPKGFAKLVLTTGLIAGPGILNAILNADDEDYDKLPYYYKNNYYFLKTEDGKFIKIPKGRLQGLVDTVTRYSLGITKENTYGDYLKGIYNVAETSILPEELQNAAPLSEIGQIIRNENFFGSEIYNPNAPEFEKLQKSINHLAQNYLGKYGKVFTAATDNDPTTDVWSTANTYDFDSTKYDKNMGTIYELNDKYNAKDSKGEYYHVKSFEDQVMKKYINTQITILNNFNSEIKKGKSAGYNVRDMRDLYQARDMVSREILNNYKTFEIVDNYDGSKSIYFDDVIFDYKQNKSGQYEFRKRK